MASRYVDDSDQEAAAAIAASSSSTSFPPIVIIGSGPCGLGAAYRLQELGHENFIVLEAGPEAGGLSITATDQQGFLWDMGKFEEGSKTVSSLHLKFNVPIFYLSIINQS